MWATGRTHTKRKRTRYMWATPFRNQHQRQPPQPSQRRARMGHPEVIVEVAWRFDRPTPNFPQLEKRQRRATGRTHTKRKRTRYMWATPFRNQHQRQLPHPSQRRARMGHPEVAVEVAWRLDRPTSAKRWQIWATRTKRWQIWAPHRTPQSWKNANCGPSDEPTRSAKDALHVGHRTNPHEAHRTRYMWATRSEYGWGTQIF